MISSKSFEPGENHLPFKIALAGHDFGFGDVSEREEDMNKESRSLNAGNDVYVGEDVYVEGKKQKANKEK